MIGTIVSVLLAIIFVVASIAVCIMFNLKAKSSIAVISVGIVLAISMFSFYVVQPGTVAVVKRFGSPQDNIQGPGLHTKMPFADSVVIYRTKQLNYETAQNPDTSDAAYADYDINTMTEDGQRIQISYTILFHIDGEKVPYIIQNIGTEKDLVQRIVKSVSRSEARNVPKSFKASDLYGENVYKAEEAIAAKLRPTFEKNGIIIDQFLLREVIFDANLTQALEDKQVALEKQTTSARLVDVAKNEAAAAIETARGQAEAARLMSIQLEKSPAYNQYVLYKGIADGKVPNLTYIGVTPQVVTGK